MLGNVWRGVCVWGSEKWIIVGVGNWIWGLVCVVNDLWFGKWSNVVYYSCMIGKGIGCGCWLDWSWIGIECCFMWLYWCVVSWIIVVYWVLCVVN